MPITTPAEMEEKLAQLGRYYRAQYEMFSTIVAEDKEGVAKWVRLGGKIMEKMDEILSDVEVYSGTSELRIIIAELELIRKSKIINVERT